MAELNVDICIEVLRQIQAEFAEFCESHGAASETDTRIKIIDRILKEVCGWPEATIKREPHVNGGYIDYVLYTRERPFICVEAKREGVSFLLPTTKAHKSMSFSGALVTDKEIKSAIDQARGYCDDYAIKYAVVTNGETWIIFRALRSSLKSI